MHIGILTGGGDVPGLNPCIRAVTLAAADRGWRVTGIRRGWEGLLGEHSLIPLDREAVRGIDRRAGRSSTPRGWTRGPPRAATGRTRCWARSSAKGIDALVTLGGDGTLRFSAHLSSLGVPVISVPKTMDNDVYGTDYCIGFSTAVSRSVEAITRLRTTTASHERIAVVELFGRRSGETALLAGFPGAGRPDADQRSADRPRRADPAAARRQADQSGALCDGRRVGRRAAGRRPEKSELGKSASARADDGIGFSLARAIEARTGHGTVLQELGYLMRAGEPDALDRMVGFAFGALAVQLLEAETFGRMVSVKRGAYDHVPIGTLLNGTKSVEVAALYDPQAYRAKLARIEGMPMFLY